jgi:hypothetical protein
MKPDETELDDGRDPALYKCKVLMQNSQPLIDPADLPAARFPEELSEAEKRALSLFTPNGHAHDTYGKSYKRQHDLCNRHSEHIKRSRTGLFTRYQKPGDTGSA